MAFSYSLSACCQNGLTFNVTTNDVLPNVGKSVYIETIQYSGCATVVTFNSIFSYYNYQSNVGNFGNCEQCVQNYNCLVDCNDCYEYELTNLSVTEEVQNFTDCIGYFRKINIGPLSTTYICAKQGSLISNPSISSTLLSNCISSQFTGGCYKYSGTAGPSGVNFNYYDCFSGSNSENITLNVTYLPNTSGTFCGCDSATIISGEFTSLDFISTCNCNVIVPTPSPTNTPTVTPTTLGCLCYSYNITGSSNGVIYYTACTGSEENIAINGGDSGSFCARQGAIILIYDGAYNYPNFDGMIVEGSSCVLCSSEWYCGVCPSPTQTPTNTQTPTFTPTNTITPSVTQTYDPNFDIYLFRSCCQENYFRFTYIPGILTVGQIYDISGPYINGCAEVVQYSDIGLSYPSNGSTFTLIDYCGNPICNCPTPTPTPTSVCFCSNYIITNLGIDGYFSYVDCNQIYRNTFLISNTNITICACKGSLVLPETFFSLDVGPCNTTSPVIQPTPTYTPSLTSTPLPCNISGFCLNVYYTSAELYNGNFFSAGSLNSRTYYTGETGGYIYYNTDTLTWCLSNIIGGNCILQGKKPCNGSCPDFNGIYFDQGICLTTSTTTDICNEFDFQAYFDCAPTGVTLTPSITMTPTPTITMSPQPVVCVIGAQISITPYVLNYTSTTTTTTTTIPSVLVTGSETYEIIDTIFITPGECFVFNSCDSETEFLIEPTTYLNDYGLNINTVYNIEINDITNCFIFIGVKQGSPNGFVTQINSSHVTCENCSI
jgi:hypothetical protein